MTGMQLRAERIRLGLSQVDLASNLGVSANTVARWERDEMKIARPEILKLSIANLKEKHEMSSYDRTMQLATEGKALALAVLKECYEYVIKNGRDVVFATRWVLGGMPVINLNTLSARGLVVKVSSSRRGGYYQMPDPEGVGRALRTLGLTT
jgi:transcriptional regulator with XRE-family HTH domain